MLTGIYGRLGRNCSCIRFIILTETCFFRLFVVMKFKSWKKEKKNDLNASRFFAVAYFGVEAYFECLFCTISEQELHFLIHITQIHLLMWSSASHSKYVYTKTSQTLWVSEWVRCGRHVTTPVNTPIFSRNIVGNRHIWPLFFKIQDLMFWLKRLPQIVA